MLGTTTRWLFVALMCPLSICQPPSPPTTAVSLRSDEGLNAASNAATEELLLNPSLWPSFGNDPNPTGEFTVNGTRVSILYPFQFPQMLAVFAITPTAVVGGGVSCPSSPLAGSVICTGQGTTFVNGVPTTYQATVNWGDGTPTRLTFTSPAINVSGILTQTLSEAPPNPNQAFTADPISTANGTVSVGPVADLSLGGPLPLVLRRFYDSALGAFVPTGFSWMTSFDTYLAVSANVALVAHEGGGSTSFQLSGGTYKTVVPPRMAYQLVKTTTAYRFLDPGNRLIYNFDSQGRLTRIEDRNGNALTVTQGAMGPTQVSDGLGRSLTFTYAIQGTRPVLTKVQDQTGRSVSYSHDSNFNLTGVKDPNGNSTSYTYTGSLLTKTIRPKGNVPYTQTYDSVYGVALGQSDSEGNTTKLSYISGGAPGKTVMTDPLGRSTTYNYADLVDLSSETDAAGQTSSYTYDALRRPLTFTDRLGNKSSVTYDTASGYIASITDARGNTTAFTYQAQVQGDFTFYNLVKAAYADGTSRSFTYNASGNVLTAIDRAGKKTSYTYNSRGQVLTATNPAGGVTTNTYNADGTLATSKLPSGDVTTYSYDSLKRLAKIQYADNTSISFTRDALDQILSIADERGKVTKFAYDANNNLQSTTDALNQTAKLTYDTDDLPSTAADPLGDATKFQYDPLGSLTAITNAAGEKTTFAYDNLERLRSVSDPAGKGPSYTYDAEGRPASVTDALGNTASMKVNQNGLPTQLTSPLSETTAISYDSLDRVTGITDALGRQGSIAYESRGLPSGVTAPGGVSASFAWGDLPVLNSVTDPNGNLWTFTYDNLGRLTAATDPLGQARNYTFDARSRIATVTSPTDSVSFTYDAAGNVTQAQYSDGNNWSYTYDDANRVTGGTGFSFSYDAASRLTLSNGLINAFDAVGRLTAVTYQPGQTVNYTYDSRGLLSSVTDWLGTSVGFTFDAAHRLVSLTRSNGVVTQYTYDADSRVASIAETSGGSQLASIALTRDAIGRVTSADRNLPREALPTAASVSFSYDAASQIAGASYDASGRLLNDNAGATYQWSANSRLLSYARPDGSASFTYDGLGQRISRTGADGTTVNYVLNYAAGLPALATVQSGGADARYYVYTPAGSLLFSIDAASGAHRFYSFDDTGSTTFLTDDSGAITDVYGISPYGEIVTSGANNTTDNPFTWQGQWGVMQEPGTSLFYARFRYYDAAPARFLSRDPLFSPAPREIDPYQYAAGNPEANGDPMGLKTANFRYIETMYRRGLTKGCSDAGDAQRCFCPARTLTRGEMAVFIIRAKMNNVFPSTLNDCPSFNPIPQGSTAGGNSGLFVPFTPASPNAPSNVEGLSIIPPLLGQTYIGPFNGVPETHPYFNFIQKMRELGITNGCTSGSPYCPDASTTREQMALFIIRGLSN